MAKPRDSVFNTVSDGLRTDGRSVPLCSVDLLESVHALDEVSAEIHGSQQLLRNGTFDFPRASKILVNQRIFLFVKESTIRQYKSDLSEEIEPQIAELLDKAKKGLKALERRQKALRSKFEQLPTLKIAKHTTSGKSEVKQRRILESQRQQLQQELDTLRRETSNML